MQPQELRVRLAKSVLMVARRRTSPFLLATTAQELRSHPSTLSQPARLAVSVPAAPPPQAQPAMLVTSALKARFSGTIRRVALVKLLQLVPRQPRCALAALMVISARKGALLRLQTAPIVPMLTTYVLVELSPERPVLQASTHLMGQLVQTVLQGRSVKRV
jgi:hypothetical protein